MAGRAGAVKRNVPDHDHHEMTEDGEWDGYPWVFCPLCGEHL